MKYLADSDFLVGLFREEDPHHLESIKILEERYIGDTELMAINLVIQESATVLSHRVGMEAVRLFWDKFPKLNMTIIPVDEGLEKESWNIFLKQTKKGCSFVDCANLAVVKKYKLDGILAFDDFYPKEMRRGAGK